MGTKQNPRKRGQGGLYTRQLKVWNEVKQTYELVEYIQATRELRDPLNPELRRRITGTGRTTTEAQANLERSLKRFYKKQGLAEAGIVTKTRTKRGETLEAYLEAWLADLPSSISPTLQRKYAQNMRNHVIPELGQVPLAALTHQQLSRLMNDTLPAKRKVNAGEPADQPLLGKSALLNIYRNLSVALKIAHKLGKIDRNPLELVKAPKYAGPEENIPQLAHIAEHMFTKMAQEDEAAFDHFLLALLGLRKGERLGLSFSDLTLTGPTPKLTIRRQLARDTGTGLFIKPATKSGKPRTVTLQDPWLASLKRLKARRKQQSKDPKFQPADEFADLVFLRDDGKPWDLNDDNDFWNRLNERYNAKGPHVRGHALRHIAATRMADLGVDAEVAMAILGHQSDAIGYYYRRITATRQTGEVAKYGDALNKRFQR